MASRGRSEASCTLTSGARGNDALGDFWLGVLLGCAMSLLTVNTIIVIA